MNVDIIKILKKISNYFLFLKKKYFIHKKKMNKLNIIF